MPRNRGRISRSRRATSSAPWSFHLWTQESTSLATADTASNTTIYTNSLSESVWFAIDSIDVSVKCGTTADSQVLYVVRKVPEGYSAPAITISSGEATFFDNDNILAWGNGLILATEASGFARIKLSRHIAKRRVRLDQNDFIVVQAVCGTSSTNQSYSFEMGYSTHST